MQEYNSIYRASIENKLSNELLRTSRIISLAMVGGATMFLFAIVFLYNKNGSSINFEASKNSLNYLNVPFLVIALIDYTAFYFFPFFFLKPKNIKNNLSNIKDQNGNLIKDPILKLIYFDRIYMIIRLALLEGVALFGIVFLFLMVLSGELQVNSVYWFWTIPLVILATFVFNNYISKEKYVDRIERQFLSKIRHLV